MRKNIEEKKNLKSSSEDDTQSDGKKDSNKSVPSKPKSPPKKGKSNIKAGSKTERENSSMKKKEDYESSNSTGPKSDKHPTGEKKKSGGTKGTNSK